MEKSPYQIALNHLEDLLNILTDCGCEDLDAEKFLIKAREAMEAHG